MSKHSDKYFIHLCFNGNKYECECRYQVGRRQYARWDEEFGLDCFDEVVNKKGEHHLFLDYGDCDDPVEQTYLYNYTAF